MGNHTSGQKETSVRAVGTTAAEASPSSSPFSSVLAFVFFKDGDKFLYTSTNQRRTETLLYMVIRAEMSQTRKNIVNGENAIEWLQENILNTEPFADFSLNRSEQQRHAHMQYVVRLELCANTTVSLYNLVMRFAAQSTQEKSYTFALKVGPSIVALPIQPFEFESRLPPFATIRKAEGPPSIATHLETMPYRVDVRTLNVLQGWWRARQETSESRFIALAKGSVGILTSGFYSLGGTDGIANTVLGMISTNVRLANNYSTSMLDAYKQMRTTWINLEGSNGEQKRRFSKCINAVLDQTKELAHQVQVKILA
jgi:hypothetical protein